MILKKKNFHPVFIFWLFFVIQGITPSIAVGADVFTAKTPEGWRLMVDGRPYVVRGVVYNFSVVGDDPANSTLRDWMYLDINDNGRNDVAYDSWVDVDKDNEQDPDEPAVGDWRLLKEMGVNTIRVYQLPSKDPRVMPLYTIKDHRLTFGHAPNKELLRELFRDFGIRVIVGHFFGEWTIGSGATPPDEKADFTNPRHRQNILTAVKVMVEEHKDEPYVLMWMLGNENFNPYDLDNAEDEVEAFLSLVNEAAQLIHRLDPRHPVALCNWGMSNIEDIARFAPDVDIFGMNNYGNRLPDDFQRLAAVMDKPVLITEYGAAAKTGRFYDDGAQARYHKTAWADIAANMAGEEGADNSIGGVIFSWSDQWWLAGSAWTHDATEAYGVKGAEWFGITGQGDGKHSPFQRILRKSYRLYEELWNPSREKTGF